jgi:hypothetical protein
MVMMLFDHWKKEILAGQDVVSEISYSIISHEKAHSYEKTNEKMNPPVTVLLRSIFKFTLFASQSTCLLVTSISSSYFYHEQRH